jgi:hypothetical protein
MLLPHRDEAYIPRSKLIEYLLSHTHAIGKSKAKFFRALGFDEANVAVLDKGLLAIAQTEAVAEVVRSPYGTKYVVNGFLEAPGGALVRVQTVWIIDIGDTRPRFVTAYPA